MADEINIKDLLLEGANNINQESGINTFMLLASMNSYPHTIFKWCDSEYNFVGMLTLPYIEYGEMKQITEYKLHELPYIITRAEEWLNSIRCNDAYPKPSMLSLLPIQSDELRVSRIEKLYKVKTNIYRNQVKDSIKNNKENI